MEKIEIKKLKENDRNWEFSVTLGNEKKIEYSVILEKEYWQKLTNGRTLPEELLRKSFQFLLEREPKESILKEFKLSEIRRYFPEYEKEMKK